MTRTGTSRRRFAFWCWRISSCLATRPNCRSRTPRARSISTTSDRCWLRDQSLFRLKYRHRRQRLDSCILKLLVLVFRSRFAVTVDAWARRRTRRVRSTVATRAPRRSAATVCVTRRRGSRVPRTARCRARTTRARTIDRCAAARASARARPHTARCARARRRSRATPTRCAKAPCCRAMRRTCSAPTARAPRPPTSARRSSRARPVSSDASTPRAKPNAGSCFWRCRCVKLF